MLDLRTDAGRDTFLELVRDADAVVEAMRPGGLERRGLGFDALLRGEPARSCSCTISGYGMTGPYRDMPSHGIAYDVWAGIVAPEDRRRRLRRTSPSTCRSASTPVRCSARSGLLAGVLRARETGEGCQLEIAQSDAAAAIDWLRSETWQGLRAARSRRSPATRPTTTSAARRAPRAWKRACATSSTRPPTATCCSWRREREFWKNFCEGVGRTDLFERWPGSQYGDHARGNTELRAILRDIFATKLVGGVARVRLRAQHADRAVEHAEDASPTTRSSRTACRWIPAAQVGADMLPTPIKFVGETLPDPTMAPTVGEHTDQVLRDVLGWDDDRIAAARDAGAFGAPTS